MQRICFIITLIATASYQHVCSMSQYENIKNADEDFKNVVLTGSLDDLKKYMGDHNKTYFDVLNLCADHNTDAKVYFVLMKLLPSEPQKPEPFKEFSREKEDYYHQLWCGAFPTAYRLSYDESLSWCSTWCIPCLMLVDILSCCCAPSMNQEENNAYEIYNKDVQEYEHNKNVCRIIRSKALQNKALIFVQALDKYRGAYIPQV